MRSRCQLIQCLQRALLACRQLPFSHVCTWQGEGEGEMSSSFYKAVSPVELGPHSYDIIQP